MTDARRWSLPVTATWLLASGCSVPLEPVIQFTGPAPAAIVVAPALDLTGDGRLERAILHGVVPALRRRGYRVLPLEVGFDLLRSHGLEQAARLRAPGLAQIERDLGVDAVALVFVHRWDAMQTDELEALDYELEYAVASARSEQVVWSHRVSGRYRRPHAEDEPLGVPGQRPEVEPVMFPRQVERGFRDAASFVAALHRATYARMPER